MKVYLKWWAIWLTIGVWLMAVSGVTADPFPIDAWSQQAPITVSGYAPPGGEAPLTNFPLLVVLGTNVSGFDYSQFLSGSNADLRFADETGTTELPYEIESWNTNGTSCVWVQVPLLTNNASVIALWGRSGLSAPAYATNGTTWDSNYIGVWHMAQVNAKDSTSNHFNGVASGAVTQVSSGIANGADDFNASADYVQVPDSPRFTLSNFPFTVSAWINANKFTNTYDGIVGTYNGSAGFILALTNSATRTLAFWAANQWRASAVSIPTSIWKQVAYTRNGTNGVFYVDGVPVITITNAAAGTDGGPLRLGQGGTNWASFPFFGRLDEVRISATDRSSNWMYACWMNMASNALFAPAGGVLGHTTLQNSPASNITTTSATLCGNLNWVSGTDATVSVYWGLTDGGTNATDWANTNQFPDPQGIGPLSTNISELTSDATYYFTYCASNANGVAWASPSETFITGEIWIENTSDASEAGLVSGTFTVHRASTATNEALTVSYARTGGTAMPGVNYGPLAGTLLLPAGAESGPIVVTPLIDYVNTNDTTLEVTLTGALAPIGAASNALMSISNESLVNVWIRANTNVSANASVSSNWSLGHAPTNGEMVYLGSNSVLDMTWNLTNGAPVVPGGWVQSAFYTGRATIPTKFPGQGAFTNFAIAGDCLIAGGSWTHPANSGVATAKDRLSVTVAGNFTLGTGAVIDVTGCGFIAQTGPGAGTTGQRYNPTKSASHGGVGGTSGAITPGNCYGSVTAPETLGSGANDRGGGGVRLVVEGGATVNGTIRANGIVGAAANNPSMQGGNAGGSVYVKAGTVSGSGLLEASGSVGYSSGGGGRVALIAMNSNSLGSVTCRALGPAPGADGRGAPGTVYLETADDGPGAGRIIVNANGVAGTYYTELPPLLSPQTTNEFLQASLIITNGSKVLLTDHLRMQDLIQLASGTTLNLDNFTLYLIANEHAFGTGTVITNSHGQILWGDAPIVYYLTVIQGPHGTATTNLNAWYPNGTPVDVSATPDLGYDFAKWTGDVSGNQQTNSSITVIMDRDREIRVLYASTDATTRTWLGLTSSYATNPANWSLGQLPTNGDTVVLDATSITNLIWGLNVPLAAWNQEMGYLGTVTIQTRYPGYGPFTNLAITGDCVIAAGTWTHPVNAGGATATDRLKMTVGGNFLLGSNAVIDLTGRGFGAQIGPGHGNATFRNATNGIAASHGGRGMFGSAANPAPTYGSILIPTNLGSGAASSGGGALDLRVQGTATVEGAIRAQGAVAGVEYPAPAGGSIYLAAGTLAGRGTIDASGGSGSDYQNSGGGRIAVILSSGNSFSNLIIRAYGGSYNSKPGAAGTIYLEKASDGPGGGALTINNNNYTTAANVYTEILDDPSLSGVTMTLTNRGCVGLATNVVLGDLFIRTNTATHLYLNGYTLTLRTKKHADWGNTNSVVYAGGWILWPAGSVFIVR